jgi:UDP-hydrolysing UDP-N-acetyl-D-glucosamine 2-epimerase
MKHIGVATFARSEYSSCLPILKAIQADPELALHLMVSGTHLAPEFGLTIEQIEKDGFEVNERIEMLLASDTAEGVAKSIGIGMLGFAQSFARVKPDVLLVVGDRTELFAPVCSALPFRIPVAHVSGGDITEGAIDDQVRHAITKMSHLHFVANRLHAERVLQMGEEPWRVQITGDPALDIIRQMPLLSRGQLADRLKIELTPPVLVISLHPTTLGTGSPADEVDALLEALEDFQGTLVFTYPNADSGGRVIIEHIQRFIDTNQRAIFVKNLGQLVYYSLLACSDLLAGNSSSGIWEAPSFRLPVINIGDRQRGRLCAENVITCEVNSEAIGAAIRKALDSSFRTSLADLKNPYGDGFAAERIVQILKETAADHNLLQKHFVTA